MEFLLEAKTEPGDNGDLRFWPSFQAAQSNLNDSVDAHNLRISLLT